VPREKGRFPLIFIENQIKVCSLIIGSDMIIAEANELGSRANRREADPNLIWSVQQAIAGSVSLLGFATKDDIRKLDARIDKLDDKLDSRIGKLDCKIDRVEAGLNTKIDKVGADLSGRMREVEAKVDVLGVRIWYVGGAIVTAFIMIAKFFAHP
jgi:hypothetical protein